MSLLARIAAPVARLFTSESYASPPAHYGPGWWQEGRPAWETEGPVAAVEACIGAYVSAAAQLPIHHAVYSADTQARTVNQTSPLARVMRRPNHYQSRSDFVGHAIRSVFYRGSFFAVAERDGAQRIVNLHPLDARAVRPVVGDDGSVWYSIEGDHLLAGDLEPFRLEGRLFVPDREVLAWRLHTSRHPLIGETPLAACAAAMSTNRAVSSNLRSFFSNMSRPSGVIKTDVKLNSAQLSELRTRWEEMSNGMAAGRVPILTNGLDWKPLSISAADAEVIETFKMTVEDIARAFRVPRALVGLDAGGSQADAAALMRHWLSGALGHLIDSFESALDELFRLPPGEFSEADTTVLLRLDDKLRLEALKIATTAGIMSPNEARSREGLPPVEGGDTPLVQQQMIPVGMAGQHINPEPPEPEDEEDLADDDSDDDGTDDEDEPTEAKVARILALADLEDRHARR